MIVNRVEQQIIRKTHPLWNVIDEMCFNAKNLYNYANYIIRQEYIDNKRYRLCICYYLFLIIYLENNILI